jgi:hypothetical protein
MHAGGREIEGPEDHPLLLKLKDDELPAWCMQHGSRHLFVASLPPFFLSAIL